MVFIQAACGRVSLTDRILEALRSAILLEARVSGMASHVAELSHDVREMDRRLVRVETVLEVSKNVQAALRRLPKGGNDR